MEESKYNREIPLDYFLYKNKYGDTIRYGSVVYYPIMDVKTQCIKISKSKVEAFVFYYKRKNNKEYKVEPMILTRSYLLNLDDVRKSYNDVEEVITRWERKTAEKIEEAIRY